MMQRINIEIHSQGATYSKFYWKLKAELILLPFAADIFITQVPDACSSVVTGTDAPFLRIYGTHKQIANATIQAIGPVIAEHAPEYVIEGPILIATA